MLNITEAQKKKMLKVKHSLEDMFDGNLRKYGVTLAQCDDIYNVYNQILNTCTGEGLTLSENVKHFFEKYGFFTREHGCGYYITILTEKQKQTLDKVNGNQIKGKFD